MSCLGIIFITLAFCVVIVARSPQGEVVAQELHNDCAILVRIFGEVIKVLNSFIECFLCQVARLCGLVKNFEIENGEVQGQSKANGVSGWELGLGKSKGSFIGFQTVFSSFLSFRVGCEFGHVTVVVAFIL